MALLAASLVAGTDEALAVLAGGSSHLDCPLWQAPCQPDAERGVRGFTIVPNESGLRSRGGAPRVGAGVGLHTNGCPAGEGSENGKGGPARGPPFRASIRTV